MKKFLTLALVGAVALGASSVVFANICAYDQVPAATLLFPFVEMDLNNGIDTQFAITNVSSEAQIVHVTVWTDYSKAILDFNIILTGYDVQTLSVSKIFRDGWLPITGTSTTSPTGTIPDADGPVSSANGKDWVETLLAAPEGYANLICNEGNPADYGDGVISPGILSTFIAQLSASKIARTKELCNGLAVPETWWDDDTFNAERPIWMYITADVAARCSTLFPDSIGYFGAGGAGEAMQNVLMGDWFTTNTVTNNATALPAVHIEADVDLASVGKAYDDISGLPVTFYSRYSGGADFREPLGTAWGFRYAVASGYTTHVRAFKTNSWTGNKVVPDLDATDPSLLVADYCQAYTYYSWDENEQVKSGSGGSDPFSGGEGQGAPNLLPLETQEVDLMQFNIADDFGWILFVWPQSNYDGLIGQDGSMMDLYQTWMGVHYTADGPNGMMSEGMSANLMANYNCFSDQVLGNLGINYDYVDEFGYVVPAANATPAF